MNALALILMTSCSVAADPVPAGAACACSQNTGSSTASPPLASRPRLFGRLRGWFHRSPTGDGFPEGVPGSQPAPAGMVQAQPVPGAVLPATTRFPTTAEPPLASGTPAPDLAAVSR